MEQQPNTMETTRRTRFMKSKYGNVGINKAGYHIITSTKEGNYKEKLEEKAKEINERGDNFEGFE